MLRVIHEFKLKAKLSNYMQKQMLLFLKYLFLIIFSSDWIIIEKSGMYWIFRNLTIINIMKHFQINFIYRFASVILFLITISSLIYLLYLYRKFRELDYESNFQTSCHYKWLNNIFSFFHIFFYCFQLHIGNYFKFIL